MRCIHPHCPAGNGLSDWAAVAADPRVKLQQGEKAGFVAHMNSHYGVAPTTLASSRPLPPISVAARKRLLKEAPCLFNQLSENATPRAIIHFCELTLGTPIVASNAWDAFLIQHPTQGPSFMHSLHGRSGDGGTVMELLCSEVLTNEGIPEMPEASNGWPDWRMPGHALMNEGKLQRWKALGDILIPCAPTNLIISVKTQSARERLLYSSNSIEGIGFGFFDQPNEFWTVRRMTLFKRMGFSAIYLPDDTYAAVMAHLSSHGTAVHATNINGAALYRPISIFGEDMRRVVGRSSDML